MHNETHMIKIDLLQNHPQSIPTLAKIWHEVLGKIWLSDIPVTHVEQRLHEHLHIDTMPLTLVRIPAKLNSDSCSC